MQKYSIYNVCIYPQNIEDVVTDFKISVQSPLIINGIFYLSDLSIVEVIEPVLNFLQGSERKGGSECGVCVCV